MADKDKYEVVNDKNIDAIKDNFTPPGAKGEKKMSKRMFSPDMLCPKCKEPMLYQAKGGIIKCSKCGNEVGEKELDNLDLYKSPNIENDDFDEDKSDLLKAAEKVIKTSKPVEVNEYLTLEPREPKVEDVEDNYNPQSEVRYTSPEELKLSEMSEEDLKQGLEDIKRGVTDYTDAEEPIVTGWIKDELAKRKSKPKDEMADFQKSLDDYAAKNKKGRDDIPVTTRR